MSLTDLLVFGTFVVVMVTVVLVLWKGGLRKPQPGQVDMVLIGAAAGPVEAHLWSTAMKTAGITTKVINVGDVPSRVTSVYPYEVWVRRGTRAGRAKC